jgi:heat shock protein 4
MLVGAVGIDFGSSRSVIAVAKRGGVDVMANEGSHRETTNIVSFTDTQRKVGE